MIKVTVGNNLSRKAVIVPETSTLREILEAYEVNYGTGMTSLDGATLAPGDIDKTFADFGITEKCYLLNVVKADNATYCQALGEAAIFKSSFTLEEIKIIRKYRPSALILRDEETKEELFRIDIAPSGAGSIGKYGVSFSPNPDPDGRACVTVTLPENHGDVKDYLMETYGEAILRMQKLEIQKFYVLSDAENDRNAVENCISVL